LDDKVDERSSGGPDDRQDEQPDRVERFGRGGLEVVGDLETGVGGDVARADSEDDAEGDHGLRRERGRREERERRCREVRTDEEPSVKERERRGETIAYRKRLDRSIFNNLQRQERHPNQHPKQRDQ
jgi:hypothetical protein